MLKRYGEEGKQMEMQWGCETLGSSDNSPISANPLLTQPSGKMSKFAGHSKDNLSLSEDDDDDEDQYQPISYNQNPVEQGSQLKENEDDESQSGVEMKIDANFRANLNITDDICEDDMDYSANPKQKHYIDNSSHQGGQSDID
jgi:hypothetical protein